MHHSCDLVHQCGVSSEKRGARPVAKTSHGPHESRPRLGEKPRGILVRLAYALHPSPGSKTRSTKTNQINPTRYRSFPILTLYLQAIAIVVYLTYYRFPPTTTCALYTRRAVRDRFVLDLIPFDRIQNRKSVCPSYPFPSLSPHFHVPVTIHRPIPLTWA